MATPQTTIGNGNVPNASAEQTAIKRPSQQSTPQRYEPFDSQFEGPFALMRRLTQEMERLFNDALSSRGTLSLRSGPFSGSWWPAMDVFERDNKLVVHADLPGVRKDDLKIEFSDGQLQISGERRSDSKREESGVQVSERSYGRFSRAVALPPGIKPDDVSAKFANGVLEIEVPIPPQQQRRRIEVR